MLAALVKVQIVKPQDCKAGFEHLRVLPAEARNQPSDLLDTRLMVR